MSSFSKSPDTARKFSVEDPQGGDYGGENESDVIGTVFEVRSHRGAHDISSNNDGETEVIVGRGRKFKVIETSPPEKVKVDTDTYRSIKRVVVEEVYEDGK